MAASVTSRSAIFASAESRADFDAGRRRDERAVDPLGGPPTSWSASCGQTAGSMPDRRIQITEAVEALERAIEQAEPDPVWFDEVATGLGLDVARGSLQRWARNLGDSLRLVAGALEAAPVTAPTDDSEDAAKAVERLADGIVQVGAAKDRLYAITTQALGIPYLEPWRRGVRFFPNENRIRAELNDLAKGSGAAGALKARLDRLEGHPAIDLRNDIVHAIRAFPQLVETCWIRQASLDDRGGVVGYSIGPLYPSGSLDLDDALPETLWTAARSVCDEALGILLEATVALTKVIQESPLAAPQTVYVDPQGRISTHDPREA
jgi:hypothetical protein